MARSYVSPHEQQAEKERALADIDTASKLIDGAIFDLAEQLPSNMIGRLVALSADLERIRSDIKGKKTLTQ
ncbi:hypothetical protein OS190_05020 [Sulfitobacter sp. F26204]|uniref:hypothetical protein n=1 Tax=Sulfitobacter sp. F26204 TaxID=2996014 RepID=UPI00225E3855|nr:hypothetical protein [Sulfitobacter sp. F26204]MCX7558920.1 hypothetical protein [Sulfitobacter sp. F26204]